ncbi:hypothetical protein QF037_000039 [Streptomyces canus]|uniref:NPCBM/NEW2 domain-containing protein n=1 Tax=Streptomyces canus TaxID=58343 RepID=UPI002782A063|nr:NPCBM/NEW2 domain-containing protein [Streptomyces canus]MDQ0595694.1 hypothetical protein [Streptomyces canus]
MTVTETATPTADNTSTSPAPPSAATSLYLSDVDPLTSTQGVDTGSAEVNGHGHPRSVTLTASAGGPVNEVEYNLGRHWKNFTATIGLRDDSPTRSKLTFQVSADEKQLFSRSVSLGEDYKIDLDVGEALRLKLTITYADQDSNYVYGTWGDAKLTVES